jgi:hypothetical protein
VFISDIENEIANITLVDHKIEYLSNELKEISIESLESLKTIDVKQSFMTYQNFIKEYNHMKFMLYEYSYFGGMVNYPKSHYKSFTNTYYIRKSIAKKKFKTFKRK